MTGGELLVILVVLGFLYYFYKDSEKCEAHLKTGRDQIKEFRKVLCQAPDSTARTLFFMELMKIETRLAYSRDWHSRNYTWCLEDLRRLSDNWHEMYKPKAE